MPVIDIAPVFLLAVSFSLVFSPANSYDLLSNQFCIRLLLFSTSSKRRTWCYSTAACQLIHLLVTLSGIFRTPPSAQSSRTSFSIGTSSVVKPINDLHDEQRQNITNSTYQTTRDIFEICTQKTQPTARISRELVRKPGSIKKDKLSKCLSTSARRQHRPNIVSYASFEYPAGQQPSRRSEHR